MYIILILVAVIASEVVRYEGYCDGLHIHGQAVYDQYDNSDLCCLNRISLRTQGPFLIRWGYIMFRTNEAYLHDIGNQVHRCYIKYSGHPCTDETGYVSRALNNIFDIY